MNANGCNSLSLLRADFNRRILAPVKSVTFYTHLICSVILGGGIGVIYTIYTCCVDDTWSLNTVSTSLLTYYPALVAASILELQQDNQPYRRNASLLFLFLFILVFLVAVCNPAPFGRFIIACIGTLFSILVWWFANGEKSYFYDIIPTDATQDPEHVELHGKPSTDWRK